MTHEYDKNIDPSVPPEDAPPRGGKAKRIPPLVWIVLALLLLFAVVAVSQCDGARRTPSGDTVNQANAENPAQATMPATPPPATNTAH